MGVTERKSRQRAERETRIVDAARSIAEREGWAAVTIRRLADEIEYSQPVLYSHFANRDAIVAAVALQGFRDLTGALQAHPGLDAVARAYLTFAREQPAVYQAMFALPLELTFADEATRPELKQAFAALAAALPAGTDDPETTTELFWAGLHGLAELTRCNRLRPDAGEARLALLLRGFGDG